ncbi:MAG: hypothetical protein JOZ29_14310 [Deltaproteobacteria bacterium]|nr:hypothetical protein [Deltaproteobacteria bacterium]
MCIIKVGDQSIEEFLCEPALVIAHPDVIRLDDRVSDMRQHRERRRNASPVRR